ncbi:hypothetical protein L916_05835 [Phytophthora nicotianae]|uniref:Uncharacterized protein n=2 Tax=Phytophthora nicotianae TaxID=4792 RepID=W2JBC1_PHYNI|nr:hypothetical protein L916_05835 [Phytophthora nicotianae]ETO79198.1 hypothetical protein F444_06076 [Phytophthora nicotianae P1976]
MSRGITSLVSTFMGYSAQASSSIRKTTDGSADALGRAGERWTVRGDCALQLVVRAASGRDRPRCHVRCWMNLCSLLAEQQDGLMRAAIGWDRPFTFGLPEACPGTPPRLRLLLPR